MSIALKLVLSPVLVAQAVATRKRTPALPEAAGPREGRLGSGPHALRVLIAGDSSAAGVGVTHQRHAVAGHIARTLPISCGTIRLDANSGTRPRLTKGIARRASSLT